MACECICRILVVGSVKKARIFMPTHFKLAKSSPFQPLYKLLPVGILPKRGFSLLPISFLSFLFLFLIELAGELKVIYNLLLWMLTEAFTKRWYAVNNSWTTLSTCLIWSWIPCGKAIVWSFKSSFVFQAILVHKYP